MLSIKLFSFNVECIEFGSPSEYHSLQCYYSGSHVGVLVLESLLQVFDIQNLAGLCDSEPFLNFESLLGIEIEGELCVFEHVAEQQEAAYDGASPTLAVVAINRHHIGVVLAQKVRHSFADIEQHL